MTCPELVDKFIKSRLSDLKVMSILKRHYVRVKPYPLRKVKTIDEVSELLNNYETLLVIDGHGVSTRVLQEYRFRFRRRGAVVKVVKNTLAKLAFKKVLGHVPEEIEKLLTGENILVFTNENPFEVVKWIERSGVRREAKPGDKAPFEIVIPAGNTGISPGPILSKFGKLKVPTRVQDGKIWVVKDVVVAKPGDEISPDLAEILRKLNIKPIFETLRVKGAIFKKSRVLKVDELKLDVKQYKVMFEEACRYALNLAFNTAYPVPEIVVPLIMRAHNEAVNLAVNVGIISGETLPLLMQKAQIQALTLAQILSSKIPELGIEVKTIEVKREEKIEEKPAEEKVEEKKEGPSEEEIAGGLASLFG